MSIRIFSKTEAETEARFSFLGFTAVFPLVLASDQTRGPIASGSIQESPLLLWAVPSLPGCLLLHLQSQTSLSYSCCCSSLLGFEGTAVKYLVWFIYILHTFFLNSPALSLHASCLLQLRGGLLSPVPSNAFLRIKSSRWTYLQEAVDLLIFSIAFVWPFITV